MGPEDKGRFCSEYLILVEWWDEQMIGLDSRILVELIRKSGDLSLYISLFWLTIFSSEPYTSPPCPMKDGWDRWRCISTRQEPMYTLDHQRYSTLLSNRVGWSNAERGNNTSCRYEIWMLWEPFHLRSSFAPPSIGVSTSTYNRPAWARFLI